MGNNTDSHGEEDMGKIKSTLDIVMEKTKSMSMTSEDRDVLRQKDLSDQARSWAQKYLDRKMSLKEIESMLQAAGGERPATLSLLMGEVIRNIRIDEDNTLILDVLQNLCGIGRDRVMGLIKICRDELHGKMAEQLDRLMAGLGQEGISGDAVIPNIARDKSWQDELLQARQDLIGELGSLL